jgi:putative membrane protein
MKLVVNWLVSAVAILIAAYLLPGVMVADFTAALVLAVVLGAINAFIKPLIVLLAFGLFLFVINAALILLAAKIVPGFAVASFWWALLFSIVLSIISSVFQKMDAPSPAQRM